MAKTDLKSTKPKAAKKGSPPAKKSKPSAASSGGKTAQGRIMEAIASQYAMGNENPDRKVIQGLALMPNVKSFNTTILNMKNKDLVTYDKTTISFTQQGIDTVGTDAIAVPQNNDAMQEKLKEQIKQKKAREIFDHLTDGRWYTRSELAQLMNLEDNKSFGTYMSALSKLVEREGGKIRLIDIAFPCGRPCDA